MTTKKGRSNKLPEGFPTRKMVIDGSTYDVPKYISRQKISKELKSGHKDYFGWRVAYNKTHMFFSDKKDTLNALTLASQYLALIYIGNVRKTTLNRSIDGKRKKFVEISGVRIELQLGITVHIDPVGKGTGIYITAATPTHKTSSKRFYVGTKNTITKERVAEAMPKAIAAREELVAIAMQDKKALF